MDTRNRQFMALSMASDVMIRNQSGERNLNCRRTFKQCCVWLVGHHFWVCDTPLIT